MKVNNFSNTIRLIKPFLSDYLREQGINSDTNFTCPFPDHEDSTPSCSLVGDSAAPRGYCYGCGRSFDIFDAVHLYENKPLSGEAWLQDTLRYLAEKYGVEVDVGELTEKEIYRLDTYRAYKLAANLLKHVDLDDAECALAAQEIERRGWSEKTLRALSIGVVPSFPAFRKALRAAGFSARFLDEIDLGRRDIFNPNNLVFTWHDQHGRPVGFTARNLLFESQKEKWQANGCRGNKPKKYNNQHATGVKCNIFKKSSRLYGLFRALKATPPLYIFEGQPDVTTAQHHGLLNCAAVAGGSLSDDHIELLKTLGINDIILCLDGDAEGQKKIQQLLDKKLSGRREFVIKVTTLPEEHDPDSFIREHGVQAFKNLPLHSAFEWQLDRLDDETEPDAMCRSMIPLIVNEPSPVQRELLCRTLSARTGISVTAITDELKQKLDEKAHARSIERQDLLEQMKRRVSMAPSDAERIMDETRHGLQKISRRYDTEILSGDDFITSLDAQKDKEESRTGEYQGFLLGDDLRPLQDVLCGEWSQDQFMLVGGKPNAGKTALLAKIAFSIAMHNDDTTVIYHTIDDTREQLVPRFVSLADGSHRLTQNQVKNPSYWTTQEYPSVEELEPRRTAGYRKVRELAVEGRLIIKDSTHGNTIGFCEALIQHTKERFPNNKILFILDNFHKLKDKGTNDNDASRWKGISENFKEMLERNHVTGLCSMEYTKIQKGVKPNNGNIRESGQIEYDANFLIHLWNELDEHPDNFTLFHKGQHWRGDEIFLPRIEVNVGKNKISEDKSTFYLDFFPACSDYKWVPREDVVDAQNDVRELRQSSGKNSSVSDVLFGGK
jgi:DNA primase catalytic core